MRTSARAIAIAIAVGASCAPFGASAATSGSTGVDGAFAPTVNTTVPLPASGIFNFTSVSIPAGVTVKFQRNTTNTPVVILASGDVSIAGTIDVSGTAAASVGAAGGGAIGDDGAPGIGGPGGYDGGRGGAGGTANAGPANNPNPVNRGGAGLGPGGGRPGITYLNAFPCVDGKTRLLGASGGGYSTAAPASDRTSFTCGPFTFTQIPGGVAYGSSSLLPLVGGSGGGGGSGGESGFGAGGGGGGGAILIASSGTVSVTGAIRATGGAGGSTSLEGTAVFGGPGGGGSGGAIRIIATTITGEGTITAQGGGRGEALNNCCAHDATGGSHGRVRLEADNYTRVAASLPQHSFASPGQVFVAGTPTLRISSVAGVNAPAAPTGNADITLPASTANPVTVVFTTSGVPVGNTVQLTVSPAQGDSFTAVTPALTGSTASATASTTVTLPLGPSVLSAQTTYTVVAAVGDLLRNFAGNERVEKVTLVATLGGRSQVKLVTVSGREYDAPEEALRIAALGG